MMAFRTAKHAIGGLEYTFAFDAPTTDGHLFELQRGPFGGGARRDDLERQPQRFDLDARQCPDAHRHHVNSSCAAALSMCRCDSQGLLHQADFVHNASANQTRIQTSAACMLLLALSVSS